MLSELLDGIYSLDYRCAGSETARAGGLAIVRKNEIMGSDKAGGMFAGRFVPGNRHRPGIFEGTISLPPNGELITGLRAGPEGLEVELHGVPIANPTGLHFRVEVAGQTIGVDVGYVGPLPEVLSRAPGAPAQ